jgi:HAD superfamily hydrolase (TIGR01509 family)
MATAIRPTDPARTMTRAILFDVEGTLVDCVAATLHAWRETLRDAGFYFRLEQLHRHSGQDGHDMLRALLPPHQQAPERIDALIAEQGRRYRAHYLHRVAAFPGAGDLLRRVSAQGGRIALATTCAADELRHYRALIGADEAIDAVACGQDVAHEKPDPALLNVAIARLRVPAHDAAMVGDTPYDARAAARAGVQAIGLTCGGFSEPALRRAGCVAVFRDPLHLLALDGLAALPAASRA